jgi:hypothetical protein
LAISYLVLHLVLLLVQGIVIVVLELISHVVLTYMVKELPTDATMREMTHVGFDSILVVILFVGSV